MLHTLPKREILDVFLESKSQRNSLKVSKSLTLYNLINHKGHFYYENIRFRIHFSCIWALHMRGGCHSLIYKTWPQMRPALE